MAQVNTKSHVQIKEGANMYKTEPWTLNEKDLEVKKTPYIRNREADLAISTARVRRFLEDNKDKVFSNNEIAENLGISLGTVSSITNRLESIADIKIVKVRQLRSALSQVFQHTEGPLPAVTKERGRRDAILNVLDRFRHNPDAVFTKDDLIKVVNNTEGKIRLSLQILLLNGTIKLVGSESGKAQYQYKTGNRKGIEIYVNRDENYSTVKNYIKEKGVKSSIFKNLDNSKSRLYYSSVGLVKEFPISYLDKVVEKDQHKQGNVSILEKIFKQS